MSLELPNLDDSRYKEIVDEIRSRIPQHAPEWTDYNLSDSGITLMELFSWLGEVIMYRLNRIPKRNYIESLKLIGVKQTAASPAHAELTFTLSSPDLTTVIIPKGTQVGAEVEPPSSSAVPSPTLRQKNEKQIVFETDEPLIALGATLQRVQVFNGVNYKDRTEANKLIGHHYAAFGIPVRHGNALLLGFASNNPLTSVEINLTVCLFTGPGLVRDQSCDLLGENIRPPARIFWEYWNGSRWRKLDVIKDGTHALTRSGHVYFRGPRDVKKAKLGAFTGKKEEALYWFRCHLVRSQYESPPELDQVLINTVGATAVVTVRDEAVGSSDGKPNQRFLLRNAPVFAGVPLPVDERLCKKAMQKQMPDKAHQQALDNKLRECGLVKGFLIEVDEEGGPKPWEEVENFLNSGPDDRHYILNRTTGDILFGDGQQGRIPPAGVNNIIARYYRYGGGARGNVGAGMITHPRTSVAGVSTVTNNWPAEGGVDEEPDHKFIGLLKLLLYQFSKLEIIHPGKGE